MRRLLSSLLLLCVTATLHAVQVVPRLEDVEAIVRNVHGAVPAGSLADYARSVGADPSHESSVEAARRILASTPATKRTPEANAVLLDMVAVNAIAAPHVDHRLAGHYARYHAHRIVAAVHYNLFLRAQKLAELVAATYREKAAVAAFRDLVAAAEAAKHPSAPAFRADLKKLEHSLKDLEEQCCPPDEAVLRQPTWQPALPLPTIFSRGAA